MKKRHRIFTNCSEAIELYLDRIEKNKPLTTEEELELGQHSMSGDTAARNRLIEANLRFVISCVIKLYTPQVPLEELISAGNAGLALAATRYNPSFGRRFDSYAVHYICDYIRQAKSEYVSHIRIPQDVLKASRQKAVSVNDEVDYYQLIEMEDEKAVCPITYESFDEDFDNEDEDAPCLSLIERVASPIDSEALSYALGESDTDLRTFLGQYYEPMEVNIMMDYAHKIIDGYSIADLAYEYRIPKRLMENFVSQFLEKAKLLNLRQAYDLMAA